VVPDEHAMTDTAIKARGATVREVLMIRPEGTSAEPRLEHIGHGRSGSVRVEGRGLRVEG
jgi:hypothetical protein